jgi:hypothetical protein
MGKPIATQGHKNKIKREQEEKRKEINPQYKDWDPYILGRAT